MREYPKAIKRLIRQYATEAYRRELHSELVKLDESFAQWRAGALDGFELEERIVRFAKGPSRDLDQIYNGEFIDVRLAACLVEGIVRPEELTPEVLAAIDDLIDYK